MKKKTLIFLIHFTLFLSGARAQIENVIVETYYISDLNDATDTIGGTLEEGSITYRIYLDLKEGTVLKKIYGDINHALKISSTKIFFNNKTEGQSFGKDFSKNRLDENTVALDSWLTLGQITRVSSRTDFGVLKENDDNGSFIGGINNDGGSAGIPGGLLVNNDIAIGIPLYSADGFDTMSLIPSSWASYGIIDNLTNVDSTIFGSAKAGMEFKSYNAGLLNSGLTGVNTVSNKILVAQLTTRGEMSFELNVEVEENNGGNIRSIKYVANDSVLLSDEIISPYLKYPGLCGCTDPNYLEYNAGYACNNADSCKNLIVFGCLDTLACNYDPEANYNIPSLCCYPGYCNDRNLSILCPLLGTDRLSSPELKLYPNPAHDILNFQISTDRNSIVQYKIFDITGRLIIKKSMNMVTSNMLLGEDISFLERGTYMFQSSIGDSDKTELFMKN